MRTVEYRWSQIRVGLFTAITGIVFFVVVFYFGLTGTSLAGHVKVHAAFDNIFGISNGSPVELEGVLIGQVDKTDLPDLKTGLVAVTLSIDRDALTRLGPSSRAFTGSHALVGSRFIGLSVRKENEPALSPGGWVETRPSPDIQKQASEAIAELDTLVKELQVSALSLGRVMHNVEVGRGTVGHLVSDDRLYDSLQAAADNAQALTRNAVQGHGAIAALVSDPKVGGQVRGAVDAVAQTTARLRAGEGLLGRLVNSDVDAKKLDETLANLDHITSSLAEAKGTLGTLINDPELAERLKVLLDQAGSLLSDVRRNPQRYVKLQVF